MRGERFWVDVERVSSKWPSTAEVTGRVRRPAQLEGDDTAFAFYAPDDALKPWVRAGTLIYATARREPTQHDLVLATDKAGRSRLRLLLESSDDELVFASPAAVGSVERMPRTDLRRVAVVAMASAL